MPTNGKVPAAICVSVLGVMDATVGVTEKVNEGPGGFISIDPRCGRGRISTFAQEVDRLLCVDGNRMNALMDSLDRGMSRDSSKVWRSFSKKRRKPSR